MGKKLERSRVVYTVVCEVGRERACLEGWKRNVRGGVAPVSQSKWQGMWWGKTGGDHRQVSSEGVKNGGVAEREEAAVVTTSRRGLQGAPKGVAVLKTECVEKVYQILVFVQCMRV